METSVLSAALPLASVTGYGLSLTCITKKNPGINLFAAVGLILLAMYPLGFLHAFQWAWVILFVGIMLLPFSIWFLAKKGHVRLIALPEVILPLLFIVLYWLFNHNAFAHYTSEGQYWGKASKALYFFNSYVTNEIPVGWKEYFPGAALFHRFCLTVMPMADSTLYFGHAIMIGMIAAPLFTSLHWRRKSTLVLMLLSLFIAVQGPGRGVLFKLFVDGFLGLGFASLLVFIYRVRIDKVQAISITLAACAITFIKSAGIVLVIMAVIFGALVWRKEIFSRSAARSAALLALILMVAMPMAISTSWKIRNESLHITKQLPFTTPTERIAALLSGSPQGHDGQIVDAFMKALSSYPINNISHSDRFVYKAIEALGFDADYRKIPKLHVVGWLVCISLIFMLAALRRKKGHRKDILLTWSILTGFCLFYLLSILYLQLFIFSTYEGLNVMSMPRYAGVFLMAYFLFAVSLLLGPSRTEVAQTEDCQQAGSEVKKGRITASCFALLLALLYLWDTPGYYFRYLSKEWRDNVTAYQNAYAFAEQAGITFKDDELLFITVRPVKEIWDLTSYHYFPVRLQEFQPSVDICKDQEQYANYNKKLIKYAEQRKYLMTIDANTDCFQNIFKEHLPEEYADTMLFSIIKNPTSENKTDFRLVPIR
ncbi:hypothetical protein [Oleidesulfovibrio sp.]|uniref:hypothetical protein n=1 Tax=Oleidesulfovibrio sp. TaxID=2909707 RepID=UPI003A86F5A5